MKSLGTLLALAALTSLAPAQLRLLNGLVIDQPALYDGLTIATALGPPVGHPLDGDPDLVVQSFQVDDSRAFAPGSVVQVYFPTVGGSMASTHPQDGKPFTPDNAVPTGGRALLFATAARNGALAVPDLTVFDPQGARSLPLPAGAPPALFSWTWYPTTRPRLSTTDDPKWRMLESLAQAIPGTGIANARDIADDISYLSFRDAYKAFGGPADRFAGTYDASPNLRSGVDLGAYLINFLQGSPGTASQSYTGPTPPPGP